MQDRRNPPPNAPNVTSPASQGVARLFRAYAEGLTSWLRRRFGDGPPEPEDVVQSVFAKLAGLESLDHIENKRAFLYTMAANHAVSQLRSRGRAEAHVASELAAAGLEIENITPERVYESKERFQRFMERFEGFSERRREIILRSRIHGQTYAQISAETGWSLGTISAEVKAAMLDLAQADTAASGKDGGRE